MRLTDLVHRAGDQARSSGAPADWRWHRGAVPDVDVHGIRLDSRRVAPADVFCCVPGEVTDGHDHAAEAVARGAEALVVDHVLDVDVAQLVVDDVRPAMAWLSSTFHDDPTASMRVIGVTGTNGKTTTAHLVKSILDHAGHPSGLVGTLTGARTTPEAPHLQASLRTMLDDGMAAVAMEVSSHALVQHRVTGVSFDVAVFTNLSPDHLDYHGSMEAYFEAKERLFRPQTLRAAVINEGDAHGRLLLERLEGSDLELTPYSIALAEDRKARLDGSSFVWRGEAVDLSLPGSFNVENAVAAAEAVRHLGLSDDAIAAGLSAAGQVAGRFEVVAPRSASSPAVIVDYSHTPAGIEEVLRSVREIDATARICVVFGAGGDRDREKRPLMGAAAAAGADDVVVTSDNPRSEDPLEIIAEVVSGIADDSHVVVEPDRRAAIELGLGSRHAADVVVIAGKGHETTQAIGDQVLDFDDRQVAREILAQRGIA